MFHSYLILTGQTTYEVYHRNKVAYLAKFKEIKKTHLENMNIRVPGSMPFHPFDLGFLNNLKAFYNSNASEV
jgi:hypothetical protein